MEKNEKYDKEPFANPTSKEIEETNKKYDDEPFDYPTKEEIEFSGSIIELETSSTLRGEKSIQQVAIAQSSIKRLQMVVKEKEDIIVTLQSALSEAYQAALQEQAHDQAQLEAFYAIFLANVGSQDNTNSHVNLHQALQDLANQETNAKSSGITSTLIKAIARLMDDYLQQLILLHEHDIQTLQKNRDFLKNQCQIIEAQLVEERLQHQLQINNINEKFQNQILEDDLQRCNEVKMYQDQLKNKCSKLKALKDEMKLVELRLKNEQQKSIKNEENTVTTFEYAKMHTKVSHLQSQVVALTNQLRQAKQTSINAHLVDHVNCQAVKLLQEETTKRKEITHKLAVQLAQYRHKEKRIEATSTRSDTPPLLKNKHSLFDDSNVIQEETIQAVPKAVPHIHVFQDLGFNEKGNELKTSKEMLAKTVENLKTKLKNCKSDFKKSEENRKLCEKMLQDYKIEVLQCKKLMLEYKKNLLLERRKHGSSIECLKIKKLLENLEEVENDNNKLQKVVMVGQGSTINKLKNEVTELKRFCIEMGKEDVECNIHEYDIPTMVNSLIPDKENEVIQLKFDRDQALWKLGQLEKRMHILHELDIGGKTEVTCEYFISPTTAPHAFARKKLIIQEPNAISLMQAFTKKLLPSSSLPREKELECMVEGLLRVVEKKRLEVEHFQQACHDTIQHMERSKQLQQQLNELRGKLWNSDECCQSSPTHFETIADLQNDVEKLRQANKNLLRSLKETEDSYMELQEKLHEATKDKFSPQKRCSFNEAKQHELSDFDVQAQEISRLQKELGEKSQIVSDLKSQLEAQDEELDFLHGQVAIKEALESHKDEEITREQMAKENTNIDNLTLGNLQMANYELSKVCSQYEELLERQAEQLEIPFQALRSIS